jgi:hypothetical protein
MFAGIFAVSEYYTRAEKRAKRELAARNGKKPPTTEPIETTRTKTPEKDVKKEATKSQMSAVVEKREN